MAYIYGLYSYGHVVMAYTVMVAERAVDRRVRPVGT